VGWALGGGGVVSCCIELSALGGASACMVASGIGAAALAVEGAGEAAGGTEGAVRVQGVVA
jgi:hypothetical protein